MFDGDSPTTPAISTLLSPPANLSATRSRSRGPSEASARRTAARRSSFSASSAGPAHQHSSTDSVSSVARRRRWRSSSSAALRAVPNSHASALPRPGRKVARLRYARSKALGRHLLSRGRVAQKRSDVAVDAAEGLAVEVLEAFDRRCRSLGHGKRLCERFTHAPSLRRGGGSVTASGAQRELCAVPGSTQGAGSAS